MDEWVVLASFTHLQEAMLAEGLLKEADIPCHIKNAQSNVMITFNDVKLMVPISQVLNAYDLLAEAGLGNQMPPRSEFIDAHRSEDTEEELENPGNSEKGDELDGFENRFGYTFHDRDEPVAMKTAAEEEKPKLENVVMGYLTKGIGLVIVIKLLIWIVKQFLK